MKEVAGVEENAAAAPTKCPPRYRGILDPKILVKSLDWRANPDDDSAAGAGLRFAHSIPAQGCLKWVRPNQNFEAGAGHRLRQWSTSLWLAMRLTPNSLTSAGKVTHAAFAHTSLDEGRGMHGSYQGLDSFLGLRLGEGPADSKALFATGKIKEFPCELERPGDGNAPYSENTLTLNKLEVRMGNPDDCNLVYTMPRDFWAADHATATRGVHAWKFAAAAKARADAGERLPLLLPDASTPWDATAIHVGVHFRVNDGLNVPEASLARIIREYIFVPIKEVDLRARVHVHIVTEKEGVDSIPELRALESSAGSGISVHVYGEELRPQEALWRLSQTDFFVGSVSSFSWIVAQSSTRPLSFLQKWDLAGDYRWCIDGSVCCDQTGSCLGYEARYLPLSTAQRLATMLACGQLNAASWEDDALLPAPSLSGS